MTLVKINAQDGSPIEFLYENPMSGSMKDVYWHPQKQYVVAFDKKQPISPLRRELLEKLVGEYRNSVFGQPESDCWKDLFCWLEKIVEHAGRTGFVLPAYPSHFFFARGTTLEGSEKDGKWFTSAKNFNLAVPSEEKGDLRGFMLVCLNLARAVHRLHAAGLAHSDLSYKNCLVDPVGGNACLIEMDGITVPGLFPPDVIGTPDFIAPEVLKTLHLPMRSDPNNPNSALNPDRFFPCKETDRHALAVLIYMYLFHRHPLRGSLVHDENDPENDERINMGEKALFVEHPQDASNRVKICKNNSKSLPWIDTTQLPYTMHGQFLKELFDRAFIDGLHDPSQRPTAADWEDALVKTLDMLQPCQNASCEKKWFVPDNTAEPKCPYCNYTPLEFPPEPPKNVVSKSYSRRLPIYLLIDCSESMAGEPLDAVNNFIQAMVSDMRRNVNAMETAHVSVIAFVDNAIQVIPLTDVDQFWLPMKFVATDGQANLGKALQKVAECSDSEFVKTTWECKGDWKPLVFIMSDGMLSDIRQFEAGIQVFNAKEWGNVTVIAPGQYPNVGFLRRVTENVIKLDHMTVKNVANTFVWHSAEIGSHKIDSGECELPLLPPSVQFI